MRLNQLAFALPNECVDWDQVVNVFAQWLGWAENVCLYLHLSNNAIFYLHVSTDYLENATICWTCPHGRTALGGETARLPVDDELRQCEINQ